jgi:hypothetical protein
MSTPDDRAEGEGFLSRWSRRKREAPAVEAEDLQAVPVEAPAEPAPDDVARPACSIPNLPPIDLDALPKIEELTAQSDFSLFLRPGVPQLLRNAALRRMWSLDHSIRDYIGPVDYQWDFNTPGGLPAGFSDQLGGDVGRLLAQAIGKVEEAVERLGEPAEAEPPAIPAPEPREADPLADPPPALAAVRPPEPPPLPAPPPDDARAEAPPPPRRRHGGALPA